VNSPAAIYAPVLLFFLILFVAIRPVPGAAQSSGNKAYGEYLSSECVTCHQLSGNSPGIPAIAGLPEATLIQSLQEYRDKKRTNEVMQNVAVRLGDKEIAALAAYFGSLPKQ
jgi:cytochrome c